MFPICRVNVYCANSAPTPTASDIPVKLSKVFKAIEPVSHTHFPVVQKLCVKVLFSYSYDATYLEQPSDFQPTFAWF